MSFGILALLVLAGLSGPILGSSRRFGLPVVVGEVLAGAIVGTTGFGWINASQPTVALLGEIGFAMLMLSAGMHIPVRTPGLLKLLPRSLVAVVINACLAVPCGVLAAHLSGGGHTAIYILLLSGGSAAIVLPALQETGLLDSARVLPLIIQIALADVAAIVAVPLVLQPSRAVHAALGSVLVAACAVAVFTLARHLDRTRPVTALRSLSAERSWALDLRVALLVLFALCWVAVRGGTSILVAGFSVGLVVGALGGPERLSTQVTGIGQGFFIPVFFVVLGARIDLHALITTPSLFTLVAILVAANVAVHVVGSLILGQTPTGGLVATAQLGLPAAVAALGMRVGVLDTGRAAAIVAAGLCSLPIASFGTRRLAMLTVSTTGRRDRS